MTNNEILCQLRTAINLQSEDLITIFKNRDFDLSQSQLKALLKNPSDPGFVKCKDPMMEAFLDGLIIFKRGPALSENKQTTAKNPYFKLTNNSILKKLRITFKFHDADMIRTFQLADVTISKGELSAWFRKEGHKNYKSCSDEVLTKFLRGVEEQWKMDNG